MQDIETNTKIQGKLLGQQVSSQIFDLAEGSRGDRENKEVYVELAVHFINNFIKEMSKHMDPETLMNAVNIFNGKTK